jgi:predicted DNA-binding transcriptional regulator AlpA
MISAIQPPATSSTDPSLLLTKLELAKHLRVSDRQIDNLRADLPPVITIGKMPRWSRAAIVKWIEDQQTTV